MQLTLGYSHQTARLRVSFRVHSSQCRAATNPLCRSPTFRPETRFSWVPRVLREVKAQVAPVARVLRAGKVQVVPWETLVPPVPRAQTNPTLVSLRDRVSRQVNPT
jgi:hypothetical protein